MKQRRTTGKIGKHIFGGVASIIGLCALATPAQAESVVFVLDRSGSMARAGLSGDIADGVRWDDALAAARQWATQYQTSADLGHGITVWGFQGDGAEQLWPRNQADCDAVFGELETVNGDAGTAIGTVCRMSPLSGDWGDFISAFGPGGSIYETHPPIDGGPLTPLAEGLCTAISAINNLEGVKSVILEADGNENNSDGLCMGAPSTSDFSFPSTTAADWGYPLSGWQARTLRRVVRFPGTAQQAILGAYDEDEVDLNALVIPPLASASQAVKNASEWCTFFGAGDAGGLCTNTPSEDDAIHWKVDLHYSLCEVEGQECAEFTRPPHWVENEGLGLRSFNLIGAGSAPSNDSAGSGMVSLSRLSTSAAVMSNVNPSIPEDEFLLLEAFANSTSKGSLRTFVRGDGTTYGVAHKLAGDVDDSGCTDQADLSIIKQKDVWLKQAVAPLQIAIKADLNRDGWVNEFDRDIVLSAAHWGEGCANPPTHPTGGASCHNNVLDGNETDTDCGGDECGNCAAHAVCETADDCVSGTCTGARCVAPVACTESKAIDLGAPGTTKTVANNACVKIKNVPSWWGTSRNVLLQTGSGGTYPVPYHWESSCKGTHGSGTLSGNWQSRTFGPTSKNCSTLIQLNGAGGNVKLVYYGQ